MLSPWQTLTIHISMLKHSEKTCSKETTLSLLSSVAQICFAINNFLIALTMLLNWGFFFIENSGICHIT